MQRVDADFKQRVYALVAQIPKGKLMTYGQLAALAGAPWAAWEVGQIAHRGPAKLPWQRVVNKDGGLASGYPDGYGGHKKALEAEGVYVDEDYRVKLEELLWQPQAKGQSSLL
ncbi:MAG TPA: MGMT family protein [Candidatus Saccharimonadales bacterium]|nr:MGMT family protein [Candidatus Saccharimonadales bacterium]